ncbi:MAG: hypothetical protein ACI883_001554 [Candidatus Azotimanducaceae bacterium]|jgi:hypothetical protein|tara:strand:+ start:559 stop:678 length:120 start_codon:yes stop_codon:yes gene_type:complete
MSTLAAIGLERFTAQTAEALSENKEAQVSDQEKQPAVAN